MNRRNFINTILVAASAPFLFLPKLIKPGWKAIACGSPFDHIGIHVFGAKGRYFVEYDWDSVTKLYVRNPLSVKPISLRNEAEAVAWGVSLEGADVVHWPAPGVVRANGWVDDANNSRGCHLAMLGDGGIPAEAWDFAASAEFREYSQAHGVVPSILELRHPVALFNADGSVSPIDNSEV